MPSYCMFYPITRRSVNPVVANEAKETPFLANNIPKLHNRGADNPFVHSVPTEGRRIARSADFESYKERTGYSKKHLSGFGKNSASRN